MTDRKPDALIPSTTSRSGALTTRPQDDLLLRGMEDLKGLEQAKPESQKCFEQARAYLRQAHEQESQSEEVRWGLAAEGWRWCLRAAEMGVVEAQYLIARGNSRTVPFWDVLPGGLDNVTKNAEAARWFRLAADQGHALAAYVLAKHYEEGSGVEKNLAEAFRWLRLAAERGNSISQHQLGRCYLAGQLAPYDPALAVHWFRVGAQNEGGRLRAYCAEDLGHLYSLGRRVVQDDAEAARWYSLAAKLGNIDGQGELGKMYRDGRGVSQDYVTAYMWFSVAADSIGDPPDDIVVQGGLMASLLTAEELAESERRAGAWGDRLKQYWVRFNQVVDIRGAGLEYPPYPSSS